ncbi:Acyl-protein synthetase LuxE [Candidatus Magnetomoraceae bacterium gMMP-15]
MFDFDNTIEKLITSHPYKLNIEKKYQLLLKLLCEQIRRSAKFSDIYANYVNNWPLRLNSVQSIVELPYLPVSVFKRNPPFALIPEKKFKRVMLSSATSGQEPSRIVVDNVTAKRMTKGVISILRDFIGHKRCPFLVIDSKLSNMNTPSLGARGAAIRALSTFATDIVYCMQDNGSGKLELNRKKLFDFADRYREVPILIYGFTTILWTKFVKPLMNEEICLNLPKAYILHSGGWKKLIDEAVSKRIFNNCLASVLGCSDDRIIDFYGMVENLGIIYPDCEEGNKHAPVFGEVIIRDPLTLKPVNEGEIGIVQVCSIIPSSFPGHLLLTEDLARVISYDGCACGRPGIAFRFKGRIPKSEIRGCGNINAESIY